MKATTLYTDFEGTASADISDHVNLTKFLESRGVNSHKYQPIGAEFHHDYSGFFSASIICLDKEKSTADKPHITSIGFKDEFTHHEFFDLFKRFKVIITQRHNSYGNQEIDEKVIIAEYQEE